MLNETFLEGRARLSRATVSWRSRSRSRNASSAFAALHFPDAAHHRFAGILSLFVLPKLEAVHALEAQPDAAVVLIRGSMSIITMQRRGVWSSSGLAWPQTGIILTHDLGASPGATRALRELFADQGTMIELSGLQAIAIKGNR